MITRECGLSIFAGTQGYLDDVPANQVADWEVAFLRFMRERKSDVWNMINERKDQGATLKSEEDETTKAVVAAIQDFKQQYK